MKNDRFRIAVIVLCGLAFLPSCDQPSKQVTIQEEEITEPKKVPSLLVGIACPLTDRKAIETQFLSHSGKDIELKYVSRSELLGVELPDYDAYILPARLLADLVQRKLLTEYQPPGTKADAEASQTQHIRLLEDAQVQEKDTTYAVSLGCSMQVGIASPALAEKLSGSEVTWEELLENISFVKGTSQIREPALKPDAFVDRFLWILSTISKRNPSEGLLFDKDSMRARASSPEFIEAFKIFAKVGNQRMGMPALIGSNSQALKFVADDKLPRFVIIDPILLDANSNEELVGERITIAGSRTAAWNTGAGLVAAISATSRDMELSSEFLRWIGSRTSRDALSTSSVGISSSKQVTRQSTWLEDSLARAPEQQVVSELLIPMADAYRRSLATRLVAIRHCYETPEQGMRNLALEWNRITQQAGIEKQAEAYRRILQGTSERESNQEATRP